MALASSEFVLSFFQYPTEEKLTRFMAYFNRFFVQAIPGGTDFGLRTAVRQTNARWYAAPHRVPFPNPRVGAGMSEEVRLVTLQSDK
jgi:hypothetical protein